MRDVIKDDITKDDIIKDGGMGDIFKNIIKKIHGKVSKVDMSLLEGTLSNIDQQNQLNSKNITAIKATMDGEDTWFLELKKEVKYTEGDGH